MVDSVKTLARLSLPLLFACLSLPAGCAHVQLPLLHSPPDGGDKSDPVPAETDSSGTGELGLGGLTAAEFDSLYGDAERLLDSLGVPVSPIYTGDVPDISDSLAAATQAQLPPEEEIFDYEVVINHRVLAWIDLYLGKARDTFNRSLKRSGRYLAMARRIFAEEGVPQDLCFLGHVESGFRHNARSPARALGLWQFMRGTARNYGLRCDGYVDERLDPEKATRASARYLRDLYDEFQDWYLALASYNTGEGKVRRAVRRTDSRDFWEIARTRYLVNETRNFVPAILAATILAKSPGAYGFTEEIEPPLEYDTVTVDTPTDLRIVARCVNAPLTEIQDLNPALLLLQTPPDDSSFTVHVPKGTAEQFAEAFAKIPPEQRLVFHRHMVHRGETLGHLARRYGTTVRAIQDANRMGRSTLIREGKTLRIPSRGMTGTYLADLERTSATKHTVRRGECLALIAQRYGLHTRELQDANAIRDAGRIYAGQVLVIPPSPRSRAARAAAAAAAPGEALAARSSASDVTPSVPDLDAAGADVVPASGADGGPADGHADGLRAQNTSHSLGRVPSTKHIVEQAREEIRRQQAEAASSIPVTRVHVVRRGDTLSEIAHRYRVRISDLRRWNGLGRGHLIYPGQEILVTDPGVHGSPPPAGQARQHVVRRGESLWTIAQRYGVRVGDLASWNGLGRSATIYPGQKLQVY